MPMEWGKEEIVLKQQGGKQASQILLEGDIIVPDSKPDVSETLTYNGKVKLKEMRAGEDRVTLSGELRLCILYTSEQGERPLYSVSSNLPIEDVIYMEGVEKDMEVCVTPVLEHLDCQVVNDRKIGVKAVISLTAEAQGIHKVDAIVPGENPEMAFLQEKIWIEEPVAQRQERFTVKEEPPLPKDTAAIGEILCYDISVVDQEVRPMDGKVMVRSNLLLEVLHNDDQEAEKLYAMSLKIPFNGYLEGEKITPKSTVDVELLVEDVQLKTALDDDGEARVLDVDVTLLGNMSAWDMVEKTMVTDAYALGKDTEVTKEKVTYPVTVGRGKNQFSMKEKIALENGERPMMQAQKIWGNLLIGDVNAGEDMVQVDGVFNVEVLYFCGEDEHALCTIKRGVPFSQKIEMKGVRPGDDVSVKGHVEDIDFQLLSDKEGEVMASLLLEVMAKREETVELVTDIKLKEGEIQPAHVAGAVIYTVQPGDSLWKIAKRYGTTVGRILLVNDIEDPDKIYPGQKLLIIKIRP